MKPGEKYWAYAQPPIPEVTDLPPGTFSGDEHAWSSLSPGYRRTIYQEAMKRIEPKREPVSEDAERLARADAIQRQSEVQITARETL